MPGRFEISNWIGPVAWLLALASIRCSRTVYQSFKVNHGKIRGWRKVRDLLDLANAARLQHYQRTMFLCCELRPGNDRSEWLDFPRWIDRRIATHTNASSIAYERLKKYCTHDLERVRIVVQHTVTASQYPWDTEKDHFKSARVVKGIDWTTGREIR